MRVQDSIYQLYINQEKERIIPAENCEEIVVDLDVFNEAIRDTENRLNSKLVNGKCSRFLLEQIARHRLNIGEKFGDRIEFYNASEILDTIEAVEDGSVPCDPFARTPDLIGYCKTHHGAFSSVGYSIVRNVRDFWFKNGEIRSEREKEFQEILDKCRSREISVIANAMHTMAMGTRELRGEWIISKELNSIKYYLCLASHKEGDQYIFDEKLKKCRAEFPELIG